MCGRGKRRPLGRAARTSLFKNKPYGHGYTLLARATSRYGSCNRNLYLRSVASTLVTATGELPRATASRHADADCIPSPKVKRAGRLCAKQVGAHIMRRPHCTCTSRAPLPVTHTCMYTLITLTYGGVSDCRLSCGTYLRNGPWSQELRCSRAHCAWPVVLRFSISVPCLSQSP